MLDNPSSVFGYLGAGGGAAMLLRWFFLRISKDGLTLTVDKAERESVDRLSQRMAQMEARISSLEASRNRLFGFITRAMSYVARCSCDDNRSKAEREILEREYIELLKDAAQ